MPGFNLPAVSLLPVPTRLTYPISEQNLNQANYTAASTAIGGDEQTTKIFWEKTNILGILLKATSFCYPTVSFINIKNYHGLNNEVSHSIAHHFLLRALCST
jgi:hypothetical protein